MAIAFDSASQAGGGQTSNRTWSHTVGSGDDRILLMFVQIGPNGTISGTPTYGGVSMTQLLSWNAGGTTFKNTYCYYLVNPTSGTANLSVSATVSNTYIYTVGASYSGVDQTNPFGSTPLSTTNAGASSTSLTTSLTTNTDNSWLVGMGATGNGGGGVSAGSGTTRRATTYGEYTWHALLDSDGAKTPTGSYSLIHTGTSDRRMMTMVQLAPAEGGGANTTNFFMMM